MNNITKLVKTFKIYLFANMNIALGICNVGAIIEDPFYNMDMY